MHQWCTGWLVLHCRVFLVPCETCLSPCTEAYTRFQNNTAMFIWSPCIKWAYLWLIPPIAPAMHTMVLYIIDCVPMINLSPSDAVYLIKHKSLVFFSGWSINRTINRSSADIVPVIQGKVYFRWHRFLKMMKFSGWNIQSNVIIVESFLRRFRLWRR